MLIVEDDQEMREMLAMTLERAGYEVSAVDSGEWALEVLSGDAHDVVLTDVRMPGMSGIELLGRIRDEGIEATVIVMTAYGTMDLAVEAMKAGAYDYVTKPFKRDEIRLALRKAEERERRRREVRR
ncbi:MAG: response regulator, partial [Myxococcales bacterium]|nr:response regulator [Myxococcales bacterium]